MTRKTTSILTLACLGMLGMASSASACTFAAWKPPGNANGTATQSAPGMLVAGQPDGTNAQDAAGTATSNQFVPRYAGKCASWAKAVGNFTTDGSPGNEQAYRVRFYVYTGLASGTATVFKAVDGSANTAIQVDYDATGGNFNFVPTGTIPGIQKNKWYRVELNWAAGAPMGITVQGARASTATTANSTANGQFNIENAMLGWVANGATPGVTDGTHIGILTDAFESRRATAIGPLVRGDAEGNGSVGGEDIIAVRKDILSIALAGGQPDATEDGAVDGSDLISIRRIILGLE